MVVTVGQLYRDMAVDMQPRHRRLRVTMVGDNHAELVVEHDLTGQVGKKTKASIKRLNSGVFELLEDPADTDPLYLALLAAVSAVHGPEATPVHYARAAHQVASGSKALRPTDPAGD